MNTTDERHLRATATDEPLLHGRSCRDFLKLGGVGMAGLAGPAALERGGHLRVGLEDHTTGPTNLEQLERAKELVAAVGRRMISGPEAIRYLDIPFPRTRPSEVSPDETIPSS